jgi:hypothetical protein
VAAQTGAYAEENFSQLPERQLPENFRQNGFAWIFSIFAAAQRCTSEQ